MPERAERERHPPGLPTADRIAKLLVLSAAVAIVWFADIEGWTTLLVLLPGLVLANIAADAVARALGIERHRDRDDDDYDDERL